MVADVPLGPAANRIDYQSFDPSAHRLYISLMGAGKLLVFDTTANKPLKQLDGFSKTTGVLVVPQLHRVFSSVPGGGIGPSVAQGLGMLGLSSGHGAVVIVDTETLQEVARLPGGVFPDGIAYDPKDNRIFVSDEMGSAITVIDPGTNKVTARIAAGGEVGNVQYDQATAKLYAPIQSKNELGIFDTMGNRRTGSYPLTGCNHPHGLAIPPDTAIGYVACDENDVLVTIDLKTGKELSHLPLGHDPDVLTMDGTAKRLYVATESGNLSTFNIANPAVPISLGDSFVGKNAHSVAVDPLTHRLFLPLRDLNGKSVMRILSPH
ncbi:MAG: YncE family protein [Alphaproteobacteria bacterium]|nr:YncE family protein [Alphaproteobacteria bacterium]